MKKWVCSVCGYVYEGENPPEKCPQCGVPASKFTEQKGELSWAAEHVVGVGKSFGESVPAEVQKEIIDGLNANFTGECTEVGMYLAMSRVAYREGYAEIGEYWRRAALPFFAVPGPILRSADKIQGRGVVKQPDLRYAEAREEGGPWMPERQAPIWRRCGKPGA